MEELGNRNLFTSEFIIGCEFPDNKKFECIETLHKWINIKEKYYERKVYNLERTQYIAFLHIIDLKVFEGILFDLVIIYKKYYPDGEKADFIQHTFRYSLYSLEKFVNIQELDLNYYEPYHGFDNAIYYYNDGSKCPIIDFILESTKEIEHYKQFYKKIIQLINKVDFDSINPETNIIQPRQIIKKKDKLIIPLIETKTDKLSVKQIALIHVYNGIHITRKNSDEIIAKYDFTSGEGLFQDFIKFSSPANRKGKPDPFSDKKLDNKIKLFESIIKYLSKEAQARVKDEIKILRSHKSEEI